MNYLRKVRRNQPVLPGFTKDCAFSPKGKFCLLVLGAQIPVTGAFCSRHLRRDFRLCCRMIFIYCKNLQGAQTKLTWRGSWKSKVSGRKAEPRMVEEVLKSQDDGAGRAIKDFFWVNRALSMWRLRHIKERKSDDLGQHHVAPGLSGRFAADSFKDVGHEGRRGERFLTWLCGQRSTMVPTTWCDR